MICILHAHGAMLLRNTMAEVAPTHLLAETSWTDGSALNSRLTACNLKFSRHFYNLINGDLPIPSLTPYGNHGQPAITSNKMISLDGRTWHLNGVRPGSRGMKNRAAQGALGRLQHSARSHNQKIKQDDALMMLTQTICPCEPVLNFGLQPRPPQPMWIIS